MRPPYSVSDAWLRKILTVLYEKRQTTRAEVVQQTRLNAASVSHALRRLMDAGVVEKRGQLRSAAGRRRDDLKLNSESGYFIAIDLEGPRVRFGLANFLGCIRSSWQERFSRRRALGMHSFVKGFEEVTAALTDRENERVLAVGVSYSGVLDRDRRITAVNIPGWDNYPLERNLRAVTDLPIFLGTECVTKLMAERWLGVARGCKNFLYVTVGDGVGVGCMVDGHVLSGRDGFAGEFGHMNIDPLATGLCNCGNIGCLETLCSGPAIVRQYLEASGKRRPRWDQAGDVFTLARGRDPAALAVVDQAGRSLGRALANLANLLNPELIVLGGDALLVADLWLPLIRETIERHTLPKIRSQLEVKCTALGPDNGLIGAASLAFHRALHDPAILGRIILGPPQKAGRGTAGGRAAAKRRAETS